MLKALNSHRELLICLLLTVITLAVFWPAKDHEFINYDDNLYVTENPQVQAGFTIGSLKWAFTSTHTGNWHPLTWLSHMLDCQFFGLKPGWHHLMNLFFHIANTLLLFLVLHRMTKALWQCAFVAALFALHPLHVESVAWVAERKDVLSTFSWMLTMGAYVYYVEHPRPLRYVITLIFFALGLMAKPMLVTLPFVLLLLDYWPLKRFSFHKADPEIHAETLKPAAPAKQKQKSKKQLTAKKKVQAKNPSDSFYEWTSIRPLIWEKVPFFALTTIFSVLAYLTQQKEGTMAAVKVFSLGVRIVNAIESYVGYIGKMIWPINLSVFYPHPGMLPSWHVFAAILILTIMTFLVFWVARRSPYVVIGWLWYLGTLVPVIGLIQVGGQAMADRYTYIPLIGIFIIVSWAIPDLLKNVPYRKVILGTLSFIVIISLSFVTRTQLQYWRDSITLFQHALGVTTNNAMANYTLGTTFQSKGNMEDAITHYHEALRINPNYADVHNNLGIIMRKQGHSAEAYKHYMEAIRINPNHANARINMGNTMFGEGKTEEAMTHYLTAIRIDRNLAEGHYGMGRALIAQNKTAEAIPHFQEVLRISPSHVEAYIVLGDILAEQNRLDEAVDYYKKSLQLNHDLPEIHYNLGNILSSQKRFDEAITHFHEAIRIKPDYAKAHNNLGSVLLLQGKGKEAIERFREALRLQPGYKTAQDNLKNALSLQKAAK